MHKLTATLGTGGSQVNNQSFDLTNHQQKPRGGAMKFTHESGSRPLEGFTIKRGVGVGGFGEVYFAVSDAGKEVALKRIQRRIDIELRGASQCLNLKHINLVSLFDIKYDEDGNGWIIMEYVSGESLKDVVDRNPNGMPIGEVEHWFQSIAEGVAYLHDHGIVHRDLKPGNIFIDQDIVKIGDYGLSKFISCSRQSGHTESVGTLHYMAPEIGKGVYGKSIDIYALGVMLYEMLSGHVPFEGESGQEIIMKHLTDNPDLSVIDFSMRGVIQRALMKDPEKRFKSVEDMIRALPWSNQASALKPPVIQKAHLAHAATALDDQSYVDAIPLESGEEIYVAEVVDETDDAAQNSSSDEEPIAKAVRQQWRKTVDWWDKANINAPVKVLLIFLAIFFLIGNSTWLIPLSMGLGAVYLVYFGIRSIVVAGESVPVSNQAPPVARPPIGNAPSMPPAAAAPQTNQRSRRTVRKVVPWRKAARQSLKNKVFSEQMTEILGSMLMSVVVSAVLCLVMMIIGGKNLDQSVSTWSLYAWLTITSVLGSWSVLILGKLWEASNGDQVRRRFVMLITGLGMGGAVFAASKLLMIQLNDDLVIRPFGTSHLPENLFATNGTLLLPAYLAFFAGLFLVLRWWRQADPLRKSRLSPFATFACVLWACVLGSVIQFPQPWGLMIAATISIAVQLSAPWMSNEERSRIRRENRIA